MKTETITFECPSCHQSIEVPAWQSGSQAVCPSCGHEFQAIVSTDAISFAVGGHEGLAHREEVEAEHLKDRAKMFSGVSIFAAAIGVLILAAIPFGYFSVAVAGYCASGMFGLAIVSAIFSQLVAIRAIMLQSLALQRRQSNRQ
jgi:uncharacterized paraquat-inducible protein A